MGLADAFFDAVADIDRYLRSGEGEAWPGNPWHDEVIDVRNRMAHLRCWIDGDSAGLSFREWHDTDEGES